MPASTALSMPITRDPPDVGATDELDMEGSTGPELDCFAARAELPASVWVPSRAGALVGGLSDGQIVSMSAGRPIAHTSETPRAFAAAYISLSLCSWEIELGKAVRLTPSHRCVEDT